MYCLRNGDNGRLIDDECYLTFLVAASHAWDLVIGAGGHISLCRHIDIEKEGVPVFHVGHEVGENYFKAEWLYGAMEEYHGSATSE